MPLHLFIISILVDLKWNLIMVLICISLMTDNVEHLFHVLIGLWRNIYSDPLHFSVTYLLLNCKSSKNILDTSFLLDIQSANIFSQFIGCLFTFLMVSFEVQGLCRGL